MDYKKKAAILLACSGANGYRCSSCPAFGKGDRNCSRNAMRDGATAITDLLARAEKAEKERDKYKDILDDYDLDRLRELVHADRDGRCVVLPSGGYSNEDGERALKNAMFVVGLTNNAMNRYIADAIAEKLTREEEAALKGDQNG